MINILRYTKRLEELGVSRELAETHVQMVADVIEDDLATKHELDNLRESLEHKMLQLEYRLTIKMGAMMTVAFGLTISAMAMMKFFS